MNRIPKQFFEQDYINLETYKIDRNAVKTPVWFVTYKNIIYVVTRQNTGKVKRIRNNSKVKICPCSFNGTTKGEWVLGTAKRLEGDEAKKAISLRNKKYGIKAKFANFITKSKGGLVPYKIELDQTDS